MRRKIIAIFLCFSLILSSVSPAYARSNAGGGDMAEFDMGRAFTGLAVNIASNFVGGFLRASTSSIIHTGSFNFGQAISKIFSFEGLLNNLTGLSNKIALKYVQKAVAAYGQYHGWKGSEIFLVSGIVSSLIGAYIGANDVHIDQMNSIIRMIPFSEQITGIMRRTISGSVQTAVTYAIDKDKLDDKDNKKGASIGGRIAGMVAGEIVDRVLETGTLDSGYDTGQEDDLGHSIMKRDPFITTVIIQSLGIAATRNLSEKKQYLAPLIEAAIDGVAGTAINDAMGKVVDMPGINSDIMRINNPNASGSVPQVNSGRLPTSTSSPSYSTPAPMPNLRLPTR